METDIINSYDPASLLSITALQYKAWAQKENIDVTPASQKSALAELLEYNTSGKVKLAPIYKAIADATFEQSKSEYTASGYVSTKSPDFSNEITLPTAFTDTFHIYKSNPIYLYMHDPSFSIGYVETPLLDDNGVYLKNIRFNKNLPFVRDVIWPTVEFGSTKQQSIGFNPIEMKITADKKYLVHTKSLMLEGSLVTIACNYEALLEVVKSIRGFNGTSEGQMPSITELFALYQKGLIKTESEVKTSFAIDGLKPDTLYMVKDGALIEHVKSGTTDSSPDSTVASVGDDVTGVVEEIEKLQELSTVDDGITKNMSEKTKTLPYDVASLSFLDGKGKVDTIKRLDVIGAFFAGEEPLFDGLEVDQQKSLLAKLDATYDESQGITVCRKGSPIKLSAKSLTSDSASLEAANITFPNGEVAAYEASALIAKAHILMQKGGVKSVAPEVVEICKSIYISYDIYGYVREQEDVDRMAQVVQAAIAPLPGETAAAPDVVELNTSPTTTKGADAGVHPMKGILSGLLVEDK